MKYRTFQMLAALLTLTVLLPGAVQAQVAFERMIVFGESTSDNGNTLLLTGQVGETWDPYGGEPLPTEPIAPLYCAGRWSNGPIWVDYLANFLGIGVASPPAPSPFLAAPLPSLAGGSNYSYTDSRLGFFTNPRFSVWSGEELDPPRVPSIGRQINTYAYYEGRIGPNDLVVLWSGANDIFFAERNFDILAAVVRTRIHIESLIALGAKHILVPNQPDASQAPFFSGLSDGERVQLAAATEGFRDLLAGMLQRVQRRYAGRVTIYPMDFYGLGQALFSALNLGEPLSPGVFKFLEENLPGDLQPCMQPIMNPFDIQETDVFWDTIHPTTTIHAVLANAACNTLAAAGVAAACPPPISLP